MNELKLVNKKFILSENSHKNYNRIFRDLLSECLESETEKKLLFVIFLNSLDFDIKKKMLVLRSRAMEFEIFP